MAFAVLASLRWAVVARAPSFAAADNPLTQCNTFTKILTLPRYWTAFASLLLMPRTLSFDWSEEALPLVDSLSNWSNLWSLLLFLVLSKLLSCTMHGIMDRRLFVQECAGSKKQCMKIFVRDRKMKRRLSKRCTYYRDKKTKLLHNFSVHVST